jgi:hypothetical protein
MPLYPRVPATCGRRPRPNGMAFARAPAPAPAPRTREAAKPLSGPVGNLSAVVQSVDRTLRNFVQSNSFKYLIAGVRCPLLVPSASCGYPRTTCRSSFCRDVVFFVVMEEKGYILVELRGCFVANYCMGR